MSRKDTEHKNSGGTRKFKVEFINWREDSDSEKEEHINRIHAKEPENNIVIVFTPYKALCISASGDDEPKYNTFPSPSRV